MAILRRQDLRIVSDIHDTADPTEPPSLTILYITSVTNAVDGAPNRWITNHYFDPSQASPGPTETLTFLDGDVFQYLDGSTFQLI